MKGAAEDMDTPLDLSNGRGRRYLALFSISLVIFGTCLVGAPCRTIYKAVFEMKNWHPVEATVISKEIKRRSGGKGGARYGVGVRYQYPANNKVYTSDRITLSDVISGGRKDSERRLESYIIGEKRTAWYNPANPAEAVLSRQFPWAGTMPPLVFGIVFAAVGMGFLLRAGFGVAGRPQEPERVSERENAKSVGSDKALWKTGIRPEIAGNAGSNMLATLLFGGIATAAAAVCFKTSAAWWLRGIIALVALSVGCAAVKAIIDLVRTLREKWKLAGLRLSVEGGPLVHGRTAAWKIRDPGHRLSDELQLKVYLVYRMRRPAANEDEWPIDAYVEEIKEIRRDLEPVGLSGKLTIPEASALPAVEPSALTRWYLRAAGGGREAVFPLAVEAAPDLPSGALGIKEEA